MDDAAIDEMAAFEDHHWWFVGKRLLVSSLLGDRCTVRGCASSTSVAEPAACCPD
jgi:hypothetical protein